MLKQISNLCKPTHCVPLCPVLHSLPPSPPSRFRLSADQREGPSTAQGPVTKKVTIRNVPNGRYEFWGLVRFRGKKHHEKSYNRTYLQKKVPISGYVSKRNFFATHPSSQFKLVAGRPTGLIIFRSYFRPRAADRMSILTLRNMRFSRSNLKDFPLSALLLTHQSQRKASGISQQLVIPVPNLSKIQSPILCRWFWFGLRDIKPT